MLSACVSVRPLCCCGVSAVRARGRDLFFWVIQSEWGTVRTADLTLSAERKHNTQSV